MPRFSLPLALICATSVSAVAIACNVPVFRYALERWPADPYEVFVLHEGALDAEAQQQLQQLRMASSAPRERSIASCETSRSRTRTMKR